MHYLYMVLACVVLSKVELMMMAIILVACPLLSPALDVYSKKHGARSGGKIVGGTNATSISMVPYQAYLLLQKGRDYYQCGGSIISSTAIMTAAHCLKGISTAYIRIGSLEADDGGSEYTSTNFSIHPLYNPRTNDNDIAIIRVSPMNLDGINTKAVRLPAKNEAVPSGTEVLVSGWGTTSENGNTSKYMMKVTVHSLSNEECSKKLSGITARMICAGEEDGGKDSCQGDSGGPAVADGKQIGVVSFGVGCARPGLPGVYARVAALRTWIQMNAGL